MYWENIHGMFNFDNIYTDMVKEFDNAIFVEIGTWKGKSAIYMAEEINKYNKNIKFYTIDLFEVREGYDKISDNVIGSSFYNEVLGNINPVKEYINIIKGNSSDIAKKFKDNSIDFLFIDGDHTYSGVKRDLENWFPKIKSGGVIGGHDYSEASSGVKMAVDQYFLFTGIKTDRSSWIFNKK